MSSIYFVRCSICGRPHLGCMSPIFDKTLWERCIPPHCIACHPQAIAYVKGELALALPQALPDLPEVTVLLGAFNVWYAQACQPLRNQARYYLRRYMDRYDYGAVFRFMRGKLTQKPKN